MKYPPHDPYRFTTSDGLYDPDKSNGKRAESALKALEAFQQFNRISDDPLAEATDLICNIMHLVHFLGGNPLDCLYMAHSHFHAEASLCPH